MQINSVNSTSFGKLHISGTADTKNKIIAFSKNNFIANELKQTMSRIDTESGNNDVYFSIDEITRDKAKCWTVAVKDSGDETMASFDIAKGAPDIFYAKKLKALADRCCIHPYKDSAKETAEEIFDAYA